MAARLPPDGMTAPTGRPRGRPPKAPDEKRVLVKVSLLPSTLDDLQRIIDAAKPAKPAK